MNTMTKSSSNTCATLTSTKISISAVNNPTMMEAMVVPTRLPKPAQNDHQKGRHDIALPNRRRHRAQQGQNNAGQTGNPGAQREHQPDRSACAFTPIAAAVGRSWLTARTYRPSRVLFSSSAIAASTKPRNQQDEQPRIPAMSAGSTAPDCTCTTWFSQCRCRHIHADGAEQIARRLLQDKTDAPGRQQRIQRPGGKPVNDGKFQHRPNQPRAHERPPATR